jgi:hypothetical protein
MIKPVKLTELGEFCYLYGVVTPASFWIDVIKEVKAAREEDEDWKLHLEEKINGLRELIRDENLLYKISEDIKS